MVHSISDTTLRWERKYPKELYLVVYLILLLVAASVDAALFISHVPRAMLSIVVTVLATTEALSICENLAECGVEVIKVIKDRINKRFDRV